MGSGHILVYAFDVFMQLYEAEGQSPRTAAELILENNLFGLDIDQRAFQLAYFALMMKGRQYSRRILAKQLRPNVHVVPNNSEIGEAELQLVQMQFNDQKKAQQDLLTLAEGFKNGAELGSLIKFEGLDFENLKSGLNNTNVSFFDQSIKEMILVGELLQQQYEIGITNPPYMGSSGMDKSLAGYVKKIYPDSKSDLFGVFIERLEEMIKSTGYYAMITQHAWMFLSSFEKLRIKINQQTIINMAHLGTRAFEEIGGEVVQTTAFVMTSKKYRNYNGSYLRLVNFENYKLKKTKSREAITSGSVSYLYEITQDNFLKIPGQPISYWVSETTIHIFNSSKVLGSFAEPRQGMATSNNTLFLREWYEVSQLKIGTIYGYRSNPKWYPYNKGGSFRKWYGNNELIVNWENDGDEIKKLATSLYKNATRTIKNIPYYFREGLTWSALTSGSVSFRYTPVGFLFDSKGPIIFIDHHIKGISYDYLLGLLNSKVTMHFLMILAPTLDFNQGPMRKLPLVLDNSLNSNISKLVNNNKDYSVKDWNSSETAWNYRKHPLI